MTDNGNVRTDNEELWWPNELYPPFSPHGSCFEVRWWGQARKIFHFLLAVIGWGSLLIMLWGVLLGWFPQSSWVAQLAAGVMFTLAGLVGASSK